MKRYRSVKAKPGELKASFGKADRWDSPAIQYAWGGEGAAKADGRVLCCALEEAIVYDGKTLAQVLTERGYDIGTLRFTIQHASTQVEASETSLHSSDTVVAA